MDDAGGRQAKKARTSGIRSSETGQELLQEQTSQTSKSGSLDHVVPPRGELVVFLNAMKYRDMQMHCKEYGLSAAGNKEVLRVRLFDYLSEHKPSSVRQAPETLERPIENTDGGMLVDAVSVQPERNTQHAADDVIMEEATSSAAKDEASMEEKVMNKETSKTEYSGHSSEKLQSRNAPSSTMDVKEDIMETEKLQLKDDPSKSVLETVNSVVATGVGGGKSPLRVFVKDAVKHLTNSSQKARLIEHISTPGDHLSPPPSDFTTSSSASKISGTRVREIVSKLTTNQPSSTLSDKLQASKDARMARLAEMRGKVGECIYMLC